MDKQPEIELLATENVIADINRFTDPDIAKELFELFKYRILSDTKPSDKNNKYTKYDWDSDFVRYELPLLSELEARLDYDVRIMNNEINFLQTATPIYFHNLIKKKLKGYVSSLEKIVGSEETLIDKITEKNKAKLFNVYRNGEKNIVTYMPENKIVSPNKTEDKISLDNYGEWIGYVLEITIDTFIAKSFNPSNENFPETDTYEIGEFWINEISQGDRELLKVGAAFYIGVKKKIIKGKPFRIRTIRFQRLPDLNTADIDLYKIDYFKYLKGLISFFKDKISILIIEGSNKTLVGKHKKKDSEGFSIEEGIDAVVLNPYSGKFYDICDYYSKPMNFPGEGQFTLIEKREDGYYWNGVGGNVIDTLGQFIEDLNKVKILMHKYRHAGLARIFLTFFHLQDSYKNPKTLADQINDHEELLGYFPRIKEVMK